MTEDELLRAFGLDPATLRTREETEQRSIQGAIMAESVTATPSRSTMLGARREAVTLVAGVARSGGYGSVTYRRDRCPSCGGDKDARAARCAGCRATHPISERFWAKVDRGSPDECWEWQGARKTKGYGVFTVGGRAAEKQRTASRVAYELTHGNIPDGLHVLHNCDNPPCCNPSHLKLGTNADNIADKIARGRAGGWTR